MVISARISVAAAKSSPRKMLKNTLYHYRCMECARRKMRSNQDGAKSRNDSRSPACWMDRISPCVDAPRACDSQVADGAGPAAAAPVVRG